MPAEEALDMSLDDLVQGGKRTGGKGKGKGGTKIWGKGSRKGKGKGKRTSDDKEDKENAPTKKEGNGAKLDMSLEEVIDKDKGKGKRGKDSERKGKSRGKGKRDWDEDSYGYSRGRDNDSGYGGKSKGKGGRKGEGKRGSYEVDYTQYSQHDDRGDDDDDFRPPRRERDAGGPRAWSDNDRDRGVWQRIEQAPERATRRTMRDREPVGRSSRAVEPRGTKRRAAEEPEGRGTKSIKVTNIPRDVNVQDIRDAFEAETGKITRCRLDRGTAWIAFATHGAAIKAVDTFDRGELNGANIGVALDH